MKWEYKIIDIVTATFQVVHLELEAATKQLNELGDDGWELVSLTELNVSGGRSNSAVMLFKRPVAQSETRDHPSAARLPVEWGSSGIGYFPRR